jgi:hypothetical protein
MVDQCSRLAKTFGRQVSYPGDAVYNAEQVYWSEQQSNTTPTCRFSPINADGVSAAIHAIRLTQCQFAVKSGTKSMDRSISQTTWLPGPDMTSAHALRGL